MDDPLIPFDLVRMFIGRHPAAFYLEIGFRTVFIYIYTLVLLRWIGGRSVAQLSLIEFLLVIALGSAVGDALFYPEVPLLHAMAAITTVVLINKAIDIGISRSSTVTRIVDGAPTVLMADGRILQDTLGQRDLGVSEITALLRIKGIRNLGEVEWAFLESAGGVSLFKADPPRPGLAIVPPVQIDPGPAPDRPQDCAAVCCQNCGAVEAGADLPADLACARCGCAQWTLPTLAPPTAPA